jgi:hypothetical protein
MQSWLHLQCVHVRMNEKLAAPTLCIFIYARKQVQTCVHVMYSCVYVWQPGMTTELYIPKAQAGYACGVIMCD